MSREKQIKQRIWDVLVEDFGPIVAGIGWFGVQVDSNVCHEYESRQNSSVALRVEIEA